MPHNEHVLVPVEYLQDIKELMRSCQGLYEAFAVREGGVDMLELHSIDELCRLAVVVAEVHFSKSLVEHLRKRIADPDVHGIYRSDEIRGADEIDVKIRDARSKLSSLRPAELGEGSVLPSRCDVRFIIDGS